MNPFEELEQHYPDIIALMPRRFDSHRFILKLAEKQQALYIHALAFYGDSNPTPFQAAHGQIATRLHNFPDLIRKVGEQNSPDIFGNDNSAALWEKGTE